MIEAFGNIWDHLDEYDSVVITTNGSIKKNGEAVMGRGIALEAKIRYPWLSKYLGSMLNLEGNIFQCICLGPDDPFSEIDPNRYIFILPVKHTWKDKADLSLIESSVEQMANHVSKFNKEEKIIMPRPGCGNGGLKWEQVKPVIEPYLDDRFTVMERERWKVENYNFSKLL